MPTVCPSQGYIDLGSWSGGANEVDTGYQKKNREKVYFTASDTRQKPNANVNAFSIFFLFFFIIIFFFFLSLVVTFFFFLFLFLFLFSPSESSK